MDIKELFSSDWWGNQLAEAEAVKKKRAEEKAAAVKEFVAPNPDNLAILEDLKGAGRAVLDLPSVLGAYAEEKVKPITEAAKMVSRKFTETAAEEANREAVMGRIAEGEAGREANQFVEGYNQEFGNFFGGGGMGTGGGGGLGQTAFTVPNGGEDIGGVLSGVRDTYGEAEPGSSPDPFPWQKDDMIKERRTRNFLEGFNASSGLIPRLVNAFTNRSLADEDVEAELAGKKTKEASAKASFKKEQAKFDLDLMKFGNDYEDGNKPKIHVTKNGIVAETQVVGPDGKKSTAIKYLNPMMGIQIRRAQETAKAFGASDDELSILGQEMARKSDDPYAFEHLLLSEADRFGILDSLFADELGSDEIQEAGQNVQMYMTGAPNSEIAKRVLDQKIMLLAQTLKASPEKRKEVMEAINKARGVK